MMHAPWDPAGPVPLPRSKGTGSFALPGDPLLPPPPHPREGKGLPASMLTASLQRGSGRRKSVGRNAMWEGAAGDLGEALDPSPSDCAPSYRAGSWQAVF